MAEPQPRSMFGIPLAETALLALDTILQKPVRGIPIFRFNVMEHRHIERLAGAEPGAYKRNPEQVYDAMSRACNVCLLDQYLARNPLTMGDAGYEGREKGATTGAERIVLDGLPIDSPDAVAAHLERFVWPRTRQAIATFDEGQRAAEILARERKLQEQLGPTILKTGNGFARFPHLRYGQYGYVNYFMAYAVYPEMMEQDFALQADLAVLNNRAAARAYREANLPPMYRLDHDMTDSRGTLVDVRSLDRIWFPHFARSIQPLIDADVRLLWHCDGNQMTMAPRLLEAGLAGFQGFQYECGMDYEKLCQMKTREGRDVLIAAGGSVSRTLPRGTPDDVKRELQWLVEKGPRTGLFLGLSSSMTPGVPWANVEALVEALNYYRVHGRG